MILTQRKRTRRGGFTLVEVLVAAALTVLVMAILATAFQRGMSTFSHLKSVVTLSEQLRSAESVIRRDLEATHLERETGEPVRVSDPSLNSQAWTAPNRGFFEVINTNTNSPTASAEFVDEGAEEGVRSYRVTGHSLAFTAKLPALNADSVFLGDTNNLADWPALMDLSPGNNKSVSPWAELYYFLMPQPGDARTPDVMREDGTLESAGVPLFTLCRLQALPTVSSRLIPTATPLPNARTLRDSLPELSVSTYPTYNAPNGSPGIGRYFSNDPSTLTNWRNRMRYEWTTAPSGGNMPNSPGVSDAQRLDPSIRPIYKPAKTTKLLNYWVVPNVTAPADKLGTELLLPNVISFQVRPQFGTATSAAYMDELPAETGFNPAAANYPRMWDTGVSSNRTAATVQVLRGVQLKLRLWDTKNKMTRQMTISIDL